MALKLTKSLIWSTTCLIDLTISLNPVSVSVTFFSSSPNMLRIESRSDSFFLILFCNGAISPLAYKRKKRKETEKGKSTTKSQEKENNGKYAKK